jgi:hypothetical protein
MDYWFIKQPKSGERVSDIGASTEESHGSAAIKKESRKISDRYLDVPVSVINP